MDLTKVSFSSSRSRSIRINWFGSFHPPSELSLAPPPVPPLLTHTCSLSFLPCPRHASTLQIALPTFVLEPRSMLERITDFFSHPDLVFALGKEEDPSERFLAVLSLYMSGWHIVSS